MSASTKVSFAAESVIESSSGAPGSERPRQEEEVRALRHLLDNFDANHGEGASGLNFFEVPGVPDAAGRRDIILRQSLADALDLLASEPFNDAFDQSG